MSSIKDYTSKNFHPNCIDDIITQYDSLSLSSSETDNITLDSGIYFDSKSDITKQSSNPVSKETLPPPPPPPYNSCHNIISSILDSPEIDIPFQCENFDNTTSTNKSNLDEKCSTKNLILTQNLPTNFSGFGNQFSMSRLLAEDKLFQIKENQSNESIDQKPNSVHHSNQLINKLNKQSYLMKKLQNHCQSTNNFAVDTKILGTCNKCQCLITDSEGACIALGNLYHSNCFTCCYCNRSLRGRVFYKDQEKIYCENDYMVFGFHKSVKVCFACGHIVTETILEALGKDFHPRCFKCSICHKCLDGIPFTVDRNNNIYCIIDYHNTFAPRCAICLQPIIPRKGPKVLCVEILKCNHDQLPCLDNLFTNSDEVVRIVVNDRDFHVECYRCQNCLRLLSNESNCFVWATDRSETNIKLLCRKCYVNQIREISRLN